MGIEWLAPHCDTNNSVIVFTDMNSTGIKATVIKDYDIRRAKLYLRDMDSNELIALKEYPLDKTNKAIAYAKKCLID